MSRFVVLFLVAISTQTLVQNKNCIEADEMNSLINLLKPEFPKAQFVINKKCKIEIVNLKELKKL
jgi:hypothetical protein|tara:strand:- start:470 stop:664 length:195 start_codon:yes stop_codon:yes gene_type:complete